MTAADVIDAPLRPGRLPSPLSAWRQRRQAAIARTARDEPPFGPPAGPPGGGPTPANGGGRDPFVPSLPRVRGRALALATAAHVLLILALAFGVAWHDETPTTVAAELWSATPQAAAPRPVEAAPVPPPAAPTLPPAPAVPRAVPPPPLPRAPPAALPDPQIAIEKQRREQQRRDDAAAEAARETKLRRENAERDALAERARRRQDELAAQQRDRQAAQAKAAAARDAEQRRIAEQKAQQEKAQQEKATRAAEAQAKATADRAEAARTAALREAQLKRMMSQAGATGAPTDTGSAQRSSGPSASYAGRVAARIKPNIVFTDAVEGNPSAVVQVRLGADGTITSRRLIQSSGVKAWDDAVLRAVDRTEILPLDNGRAPPQFEIGFRPKD